MGFALNFMMARREFLKQAGIAAAAQSAVRGAEANTVLIDPKPLFEISPHLYMQFMEPLGTTDSSVEAAWNYDADDWAQGLRGYRARPGRRT